MQLRTLAAITAVVTAFIAGRSTAPRVEAKPIVTVRPEAQAVMAAPAVRCPTVPAIEVDAEEVGEPEDPDAIEVEQSEAMRMLEVESKRLADLEASLGTRGALRGQVRDKKTGEILVGVTVVASAGDSSHTAITDENGWFEIAPLPASTYTVTLYYADVTLEHRDVAVAAGRVTPLYGKLDSTPRLVIEDLGHGITIEQSDVEDIVVERHLEDPDAPDEAGVTFSGDSFLENEYYVD